MNSFCFQVDPQNGTVGFGSGLQGWAFTLKDFAKMYCKKFKIEESKMMKRLWGDNFYLEADKKWTTNQSVADDEARGFSKYVLTPIYHVSLNTVQILCIGTDRSQQTVQTKIRLLIKQCRPRSNSADQDQTLFAIPSASFGCINAMLHQTFLLLGQLWQLFEVSQILEFLRYRESGGLGIHCSASHSSTISLKALPTLLHGKF